jgi:hypothetical protein
MKIKFIPNLHTKNLRCHFCGVDSGVKNWARINGSDIYICDKCGLVEYDHLEQLPGKKIVDCHIHHKYEGKYTLVKSDYDDNCEPELVRLTDKRLLGVGIPCGYPISIRAKCTNPVKIGVTICKVIDCDHDDVLTGKIDELILEPIVNLGEDYCISLPMLHFFNTTNAFADSYKSTRTFSEYGRCLNYKRLYSTMIEIDPSIDCEWTYHAWNIESSKKILQLLIDGKITALEIFNIL